MMNHASLVSRIGAIFIVLVLAACSGGGGNNAGSGNPVVNPPPPAASTLINGGTVTGTDGVAIHALNDTLSAPIDAFIEVSPMPAEALPANTLPRGNYYQLRASVQTPVSTLSPFVLSFPVPAGADTAHLALAVRVPSEEILDAHRSGWEWLLMDGRYDATQNTFLTTSPFLAGGDGRTYVLVEHPDFASPPTGTTSAAAMPKAAAANKVTAQSATMAGFDFIVECIDLSPTDCSADMKQEIATLLTIERTELTSMGYREPRLKVVMSDLGLSNGDLTGTGYKVNVVSPGSSYCFDSTGEPVGGAYHPDTAELYVCVGASVAFTTIHEYFHATQHAYAGIYPGKPEKWFIEGTATAAEGSFTNDGLMRRSYRRPLHHVDIDLRSVQDTHEYDAQDFWVYAGIKLGKDMDYLLPIFFIGGTIEDIDSGFRMYGSSLKAMYWAWAKNQVYEKEIDFEGVLTNKCHFELLTANSVLSKASSSDLGDRDYGAYFQWNTETTPTPIEGVLAPLTSVTFRLEEGVEGFHTLVTLREENSSTDPDIVYKIYSVSETTCGNEIPDGSRTLNTLTWKSFYWASPYEHTYILISNLNPTTYKNFKLTGEGQWVPF